MTSTSSKRYAIIGTGAIGGYYGARLQQAGCEVHFLLRSDYEQVRDRGLIVESVDGDFTLPQVYAYSDPAQMPPIDVVIVALKGTMNDRLPALMPPLAPDAIVLTLQNGLDIEAGIAQWFDPERILGGLCFICANKIGSGHIRHVDYSKIVMGAHSPRQQRQPITADMEAIAADFERARIPMTLTDDLLMTRWRKLVWNVPYNGLSVVLDAQTDEMMANPDLRSLITSLMTEVVTVANAWGAKLSAPNPSPQRQLPEDLIPSMLDHTDQMRPYRTSMKLDYDSGRPLEVETILGNPVRAAAQIGIPAPQMTMLYQQVKFLDQRQQQSAAQSREA